MTTTTLAPDARRNVVLFSLGTDKSFKPKFRFEKKVPEGGTSETDVLVVTDLPVFRSGTFRDSMGNQHTWEEIQMEQMVAHFDLLRSRGILSDVPVRAGHPGFLTNALHEVIGYHTGLRTEKRTNPVDGVEHIYLLGNFEVIDPGAIEKISNGLWRNVSSEVGGWLSNNETEFWPVYQGVAYVDFPAVEGLKKFNSHNGVGQKFSLMLDTEKEAPVSGNDNQTTPPTQPVTPPSQPVVPPAPPAPVPAPPAQHAAPVQPFVFTVGGRQVTDYSAVQAHITNLETAAAETKANNRKNFIKGLADKNVILATQIAGIESYALGMDDSTWEAFEKSWSAVAPAPLLANHGAPGQQTGQVPGAPAGTPQAQQEQEIQDLEGILKQHRMGGMTKEAIEKTASFQKLKALKPTSPALVG